MMLSLMIVCFLVVGCEKLPATLTTNSSPTSPASMYPADISGHVTIAEVVQAKYDRDEPDTMELTPLEGQIYWLVDISVNNKSYNNPITASGWKIVVDDKTYDAQKLFMSIQSSYPMTVPVGGAGETTIRFPVPNTLEVSDAKLCYQGQEPYSYGKLTGGDTVAVYDWDSKTVIKEQQTVESLTTGERVLFYIPTLADPNRTVELKVIKEWSGTESTVIKYKPEKTPWAINAYYKPTSQIKSSLSIVLVPMDAIEQAGLSKSARMIYSLPLEYAKDNTNGGSTYGRLMTGQEDWAFGFVLSPELGTIDIEVQAVGCEWTIKIGVE